MSVRITINNNGPFKVEGPATLVDSEGREFNLAGKTTVFLCRCGQTQKAPFCDGTHKTCGYVSTVSAPG